MRNTVLVCFAANILILPKLNQMWYEKAKSIVHNIASTIYKNKKNYICLPRVKFMFFFNFFLFIVFMEP